MPKTVARQSKGRARVVILDSAATDPATIAALAGAALALGVVYWLLQERDDRMPRVELKTP